MHNYSIFLVDDEDENLITTKGLLSRWGYDVDSFPNGKEALECVKSGIKEYAVAILDYRMPQATGAEIAQNLQSINPDIIVLIYSAYPTVDSLKASIRAGALNFIEKNEDLNYLKTSIENACKEYEKIRPVRPPFTPNEATKLIATLEMVGRSEKLARVAEQVQKYKSVNKPVLILGETGVGKEMIAQALHSGSKDFFFAVSCAAFQGNSLVESELFGHEKGAFTGAVNRKAGILEAAKGGTVFLDEIHTLDLQSQSKLLRALREKKIRRVGGLKEENVDFRLLASCRPDIEKRVKEGTFLPDLYYRIKFLCIEIPPLRDRPEDIEPLALHFCEKHFKETGIQKKILARTIRKLEQMAWEGNVGELDGVVSALIANSCGDSIDDSFLGASVSKTSTTFGELRIRQEKERRQLIQSALQSSRSDRHAASKLGLKPSSFHSLLTRMGIRREILEDQS